MRNSPVCLGDKGFFVTDVVLALWLRLLALHVPEPTKKETIPRAIRDDWLLQSRGWCHGFLSVGLDKAASSPEGQGVVRNAIASLSATLEQAPHLLSAGTLNLLGIEEPFKQNFETARLLEVGKAVIDLLDGKIGPIADNLAFHPGSKW